MKPAVFLDRDGVIIADKNYLSDPDGVELLPGAVEGLHMFQAAGFILIIVTNQSGVGRGMFSIQDAEAVNDRVVELLAKNTVTITATYYCPHAPGDNCLCRKPNPGMLLQAAAEHDIDLRQSIMIGDKEADVMAGEAAQCRCSILIAPTSTKSGEPIAPNLEVAARYVLFGVGARFEIAHTETIQ